ncbi:MAG: GNAT family N-acetyltransferase [Geminicoccaceae bacterium]
MIDFRADSLELRLARSRAEIKAAQALRYRVFYKEMGALPNRRSYWLRRDVDRFDAVCDHVIVLDRAVPGKPRVVGTYRLMRGTVARRQRGFYTAGEFDLSGFGARADDILELGRSCVDPGYRTGAVMQLLWRGIASYVRAYGLRTMLGCASLPGTDPDALAHGLSYLHHNYRLEDPARPRALPSRYVALDRIPPEQIDRARVKEELPPLLKGYLRLGGRIGDGAVIDHSFNTIDVCLILPVANVKARYLRHYLEGEADEKQAA